MYAAGWTSWRCSREPCFFAPRGTSLTQRQALRVSICNRVARTRPHAAYVRTMEGTSCHVLNPARNQSASSRCSEHVRTVKEKRYCHERSSRCREHVPCLILAVSSPSHAARDAVLRRGFRPRCGRTLSHLFCAATVGAPSLSRIQGPFRSRVGLTPELQVRLYQKVKGSARRARLTHRTPVLCARSQLLILPLARSIWDIQSGYPDCVSASCSSVPAAIN